MLDTILSGRADLRIRRLAREAAKTDGWMRPTDDKSFEDYGDYEQDEIAGWSETCHFEMIYLRQLLLIGDQQAKRHGFDQASDGERFMWLMEDIKEIFWAEWIEAVNLYDYWEKNVKSKVK